MSISQYVKLQILETCGGPTSVPDNLPDYVPLAYLGFDEDLLLMRILEIKLRQLAVKHNTGKHLPHGCLCEYTTVSQCIALVA